jgi:hypothetical protein
MPFKNALLICNMVGGQLPNFVDTSDHIEKYNWLRNSMVSSEPNVSESSCKAQNETQSNTWGGFKQIPDGSGTTG